MILVSCSDTSTKTDMSIRCEADSSDDERAIVVDGVLDDTSQWIGEHGDGLVERHAVLAAFDDHLRRVRGVCPEVRRSYGRVAGEFLEMVFGDGPVDLARLSAGDVMESVFEATVREESLRGTTRRLGCL